MFKFKNKDREIAEEQYSELLESIGEKKSKNNAFVLGETKNIYSDGLSLDDIISDVK